MEANDGPFNEKVKLRVTSATAGDAESIPARLFGRTTSPRIEKIETTAPPAKKRITYSTSSSF
jgi:hypothetical protein